MCCRVNSTSGKVFLAVAAFFAVSAITLLVMGILGATGNIPMAPIGARLMIGLGIGTIVGMIGGVIKFCCKK